VGSVDSASGRPAPTIDQHCGKPRPLFFGRLAAQPVRPRIIAAISPVVVALGRAD